jgi:hypothetical protein
MVQVHPNGCARHHTMGDFVGYSGFGSKFNYLRCGVEHTAKQNVGW